MITGNAGYPSDAGPDAGIHVYACDVRTSEITQEAKLDYETGDFEIELPPDTYYVFAGANENIEECANDFYDKTVPCGLTVDCNDYSLIPVEVKAGGTVSGIVTGDWFRK
jgi:hypothetical protein